MKSNKLLVGLLSLAPLVTNAADFYTEAGLIDWDNNHEQIFGKQRSENTFVRLVGVNGTDFGDIYGNITIEDIDDSAELGIEAILIGQANLGSSDFNLYGQVFAKNEPDWAETMVLPGISWDKVLDNGLYLQGALAANFIIADYRGLGTEWENGYNGGYLFLCAAKGFSAFGQDFNLMWNQENFVGRDDIYLEVTGDKKDFGFNGWLTLDWFATENVALSLSYRYSQNNLGVADYADAIFYSVKYSF
ncbi:outer membrane protein OmpK [Ferrimonas sp. SCSIO 43195]|uniref:outer membrane protein OmpK n=1 Tax=Ferrimonas sp. SCSIO 43195 TaxID=2822844 RepID=UPI002076032C|nr:outer membrane protein OmpK [Ferrimonas sp. SCSIO 43195]USD37534.1 hypothetical protein J8Z22_21630 [Ferrimonas sp. SCSIO 43195]